VDLVQEEPALLVAALWVAREEELGYQLKVLGAHGKEPLVFEVQVEEPVPADTR